MFDLFLFSVDPEQVRTITAAGVAGIVVDWEFKGKEDRQKCANTEINRHTLEDLKNVRTAASSKVICRINRFSAEVKEEIELAIHAGADEILLPMVEGLAEVEQALAQVAGRVGLGM